jgi:hypothetical protein
MFRGSAAMCKQREQMPATVADQLLVNSKILSMCVHSIGDKYASYEIWSSSVGMHAKTKISVIRSTQISYMYVQFTSVIRNSHSRKTCFFFC